jgi:hypothetical protein
MPKVLDLQEQCLPKELPMNKAKVKIGIINMWIKISSHITLMGHVILSFMPENFELIN